MLSRVGIRRYDPMVRLTLALLFALAGTGCAAVFQSSQQSVRFESDPQGAKVENNGRYIGETPASGTVNKLSPMNIRVSSPGYAPSEGALERHVDGGWVVADVLTCVIPVLLCVPLIVDGVTGAWMDIEPTYRVKLEKSP